MFNIKYFKKRTKKEYFFLQKPYLIPKISDFEIKPI